MSLLYPATMSATFVDNVIWNIGLLNTPNNERNFLRGIHHADALYVLMTYLSSHQPGKAMRLTSAWVDKHPQAHPLSGAANCEVGDLLVLWRRLDSSGRVLRRVGWLLQAKAANDPAAMSYAGASSLKEYALYENGANWHFALKHFSDDLGSFNLAKDVDLDPAVVLPADVKHWSYLQIRKPKAVPAWATPLQTRWDSSGIGHWLNSFAEGIASMMEPSPGKGVLLDTVNPQWTALCDALEAFTVGRNSALAGGLWQRSCMALAGSSAATPAFVHGLVTEGLLEFPGPRLVSPWSGGSGLDRLTAIGGEGPGEPDRVSAEFDGGGGFGVVRLDSIDAEEGHGD